MIASIVKKLTPEYLEQLKETVNTEDNPVKYVAIDPGKSNGFCGYDASYNLQLMQTVQASDMILFLHQFNKVTDCIVENFNLYPNKAKDQCYSDMETSRIIGRIEHWTERKDIVLHKQPANIKTTGYKWIGQKPLPKNDPNNHNMDAHVHFMYWAVINGRINAEDLLKKGKP